MNSRSDLINVAISILLKTNDAQCSPDPAYMATKAHVAWLRSDPAAGIASYGFRGRGAVRDPMAVTPGELLGLSSAVQVPQGGGTADVN